MSPRPPRPCGPSPALRFSACSPSIEAGPGNSMLAGWVIPWSGCCWHKKHACRCERQLQMTIGTEMPILESARLLVRPFVLEDLAGVHRLLDIELSQAN